MDLMSLMEVMGSSDIPIVAAFFIGLMTAISPCPLATNISAIAFISRKIGGAGYTLSVSLAYTLGRAVTYIAVAALIVWAGMSSRAVSMVLQDYGELIIGPLLLVCGILMLGLIKLPIPSGGSRFDALKKHLAERGIIGAFFLGCLFAVAFCPFSAVLFFGMLIPICIASADAILAPAVFALATGLPVIVFSLILAYSAGRIGSAIHKVQSFELWFRRIAAILFVLIGLYLTLQVYAT